MTWPGDGCGDPAAIAGRVPLIDGEAQLSQLHGNGEQPPMVDSRRAPVANVPACSQAPPAVTRRRRANIRPFSVMERDQLLAGCPGWLRVN
jgi:hypothetical protein